MMLKKKSNNWARLKLLLLVPVGLMALSVFARPEANPVPENANNGTTSLSEDKSTVIQQTVQQDYGVFLTYNDPNGKDQISMICKNLENVIHRAESGQLKDAKEVTINPAEENTPAVYLEKAKEALEKRNIKARIDPTVPGSIVAKSMLPTRKSTNFIYGIQNKKIVFAISIESLKEERLEFTRYNFSKSESITLQPESSQTSIKELERLKKSLEEKGYYTCTIDTNVFKRGDAVPLPPPPLPPMGQVVFSYKKGEPDQQFVLYERHARSGKNLDQRIDKIYNDDITNVNIIISKNAPKGLKDTVVKALQQKIKYDVQYNVLQMTE